MLSHQLRIEDETVCGTEIGTEKINNLFLTMFPLKIFQKIANWDFAVNNEVTGWRAEEIKIHPKQLKLSKQLDLAL